MAYTRRIIDDVIDDLLPDLPAISIDGPKAIGKTATAKQRASEVLHLDDPATAQLLLAGPERIATYNRPLLLDEWQRIPQIWDQVRRLVDEDPTGGRFILTGSAIPMNAPVHSGAGRIVQLRMRPLAVAERGIETPTVRLSDLISGNAQIDGRTKVGLADYIREIVASGFPAIRPLNGRARRIQLDGYIERAIQRDIPEMGKTVRLPQQVRRWLAAYAAASSSTASYALIGRTAYADGATPSRDTIVTYREALSHLWLLDQVPAWTTGHNNFTKQALAPKHFLADPALSARLLNLDEERLLRAQSPADFEPQDGTILGALFEALVALSLQTYAAANDAQLSHYRNTPGTHEIDFIVHRGDDDIVAFEVKLAKAPDKDAVKHLLWMKEQLGSKLKDMVLITSGSDAYRRQDGVAVVPLALLGH
ncbi:ATP-binding protein [Conyzicola sp.]|uniref:ATP-binding protein n=1 Tax=Conyzicola sp. TaxID=1969404 RepID=UPI003988EBF3